MEDDTEVILKLEDWQNLVQDQRLLNALQQAGVDNWDGYDFALDILDGDLG